MWFLLTAQITLILFNKEFFKIEFSKVFYANVAFLFLMCAILIKNTPSDELLEEFKAWGRWIFSLFVITYLIVLSMEYPTTKKEFERVLLATVTFVLARYYPSVIGIINKRRVDHEGIN